MGRNVIVCHYRQIGGFCLKTFRGGGGVDTASLSALEEILTRGILSAEIDNRLLNLDSRGGSMGIFLRK